MKREGALQRYLSWKNLFLAGGILFLLLLPLAFIERAREEVIALASPLFKSLASPLNKRIAALEAEKRRLELENNLLRSNLMKEKREIGASSNLDREGFLKQNFLTARPVYWDLKGGGHFLWIDVGENANRKAKKRIIEKNSPVLSGRFGVGVVDEVGKTVSRIRLLTDPLVHPSVQATRGQLASALLLDHIDALLATRESLFLESGTAFTKERRELFKECLLDLKASLTPKAKSWYFARGILQGRQGGNNLKKPLVSGLGFTSPSSESDEAIQKGDLLVTTGLDGVFPAGIIMAEVERVFPIQEGDPTFEFEAKLFIDKWDASYPLFILPPLAGEIPLG